MMLGVNDYLQIDRTQWMQNWPGQIVLNGSQASYLVISTLIRKNLFLKPVVTAGGAGRKS